jgi:hypothetical protein
VEMISKEWLKVVNKEIENITSIFEDIEGKDLDEKVWALLSRKGNFEGRDIYDEKQNMIYQSNTEIEGKVLRVDIFTSPSKRTPGVLFSVNFNRCEKSAAFSASYRDIFEGDSPLLNDLISTFLNAFKVGKESKSK